MLRKLLYIFLFCATILIPTELMINTLTAGYEAKGNAIMLVVAPAAVLFGVDVWLTGACLVPRFLLKGKIMQFSLLTFIVAYLTIISCLIIENMGCRWAGLPLYVTAWDTPWPYLERFCESLTMTTLLFALGANALFEEWRKGDEKEREMTENLNRYIRRVRDLLDHERIMAGLEEIRKDIRGNIEQTGEAIGRLSRYLRRQLYEIPPLAEVEQHPVPAGSRRVADFLTEHRWRWARRLGFQLLILTIAAEAFFSTPNAPAFDTTNIIIVASIWILLNFLTLINRYWFYKRYRRHKSISRYLTETVAVIVVPMLIFMGYNAVRVAMKGMTLFDPALIVILSSFGAIMTLMMFVAGVSAIFLFQYWVAGQRRTHALASETVRQEYLFLKKQINPHFLFNVLNNINILSYEDQAEALRMLDELERMIEYQFFETSAPLTTPTREYSFLDSYLRLEASRTDNLTFSISTDSFPAGGEIPTLLLIPLVENAVKHSKGVPHREIEVELRRQGEWKLLFRCSNNYPPAGSEREGPGGLGLLNLRRRLTLLYGGARNIRESRDAGRYSVTLILPLVRK
ncbi:MAG: histidine kinase [Muribaculaceae bacterium]|nr:histidine kinase [Muribaculaceae bacterium]